MTAVLAEPRDAGEMDTTALSELSFAEQAPAMDCNFTCHSGLTILCDGGTY